MRGGGGGHSWFLTEQVWVWGLRTCISSEFPGDADANAAGPGTTLPEASPQNTETKMYTRDRPK